jgi:hypothetical protein
VSVQAVPGRRGLFFFSRGILHGMVRRPQICPPFGKERSFIIYSESFAENHGDYACF